MNNKSTAPSVKTAKEIQDDMDTAISLQAVMAMQGRHLDFRADPDIMAMINGEISDDEFAARTERAVASLPMIRVQD